MAGFILGAVFAVVGFVTESTFLIQVALGILILAWMTRLLQRRDSDGD